MQSPDWGLGLSYILEAPGDTGRLQVPCLGVRGPGFHNTFLVEAKTKGIHIASWRDEVMPFAEFTVGIKRPTIDKDGTRRKPQGFNPGG